MIPANFPELLAWHIEAEIVEETKRLAAGMAADWADYRNRVGRVAGLRRVSVLIEQLTEDRQPDDRKSDGGARGAAF